MFPKTLILLFVLTLVSGEAGGKGRSRNARIFSFQTLDEDLQINLEFSIPFLSIPVKKAMESAFGISGLPMININPASLIIGGAVLVGAILVIPSLLKNYSHQNPYHGYSRLLDTVEFSGEHILEFATKMASEGNSLHGCTLKVACWTGQKYMQNSTHMWRKAISNKLLSMVVNATAIEDAVFSGTNGRDCDFYKPCPLGREFLPYLPMVMNNLSQFTNTYLKHKS